MIRRGPRVALVGVVAAVTALSSCSAASDGDGVTAAPVPQDSVSTTDAGDLFSEQNSQSETVTPGDSTTLPSAPADPPDAAESIDDAAPQRDAAADDPIPPVSTVASPSGPASNGTGAGTNTGATDETSTASTTPPTTTTPPTAPNEQPATTAGPAASSNDPVLPGGLVVPLIGFAGDERNNPVPYFGLDPAGPFTPTADDRGFCDAVAIINARPRPADDFEELVVGKQYFEVIQPLVPEQLSDEYAAVLVWVTGVVDAGSFDNVEDDGAEFGLMIAAVDVINEFVNSRCLGL